MQYKTGDKIQIGSVNATVMGLSAGGDFGPHVHYFVEFPHGAQTVRGYIAGDLADGIPQMETLGEYVQREQAKDDAAFASERSALAARLDKRERAQTWPPLGAVRTPKQ